MKKGGRNTRVYVFNKQAGGKNKKAYSDSHVRLDTEEGEKDFYHVARQSHRESWESRMYWRGGTSWGAGGKKKESEEDGWRTARATLAAGLDDMSVGVCGCLEEISVNLLTQVFSLGKWEDT